MQGTSLDAAIRTSSISPVTLLLLQGARVSGFVKSQAGANVEMNDEKGKWSLWISDAKSAFLQGEQNREERAGPLFMKAPCDPLVLETGTFAADLYEVRGSGYGLPSAPRVWSRRRSLRRRGQRLDQSLAYPIGAS